MVKTHADDLAAAKWTMLHEHLVGRGINDDRVLRAFERVPREQFVPHDQRPYAYDDRALAIGYGQTISQPYMVAWMLQALDVQSEHRVLEVGAGSGYQAALLGELAREVYALELVPELAERAAAVVARLGYETVHIVAGDGSLGHPPGQPYDRIIVAAAAPTMPEPLVEQLAEGGLLLAPVGGRGQQQCLTGVKRGGQLALRPGPGCTFVPLRGQHGWSQRAWPGE